MHNQAVGILLVAAVVAVHGLTGAPGPASPESGRVQDASQTGPYATADRPVHPRPEPAIAPGRLVLF